MSSSTFFVYIVECADGSLYTGWAVDVERRLAEHNSGRGAAYTRSRLPVRLLYQEQASDRSSALKREREIKNWRRPRKFTLINR